MINNVSGISTNILKIQQKPIVYVVSNLQKYYKFIMDHLIHISNKRNRCNSYSKYSSFHSQLFLNCCLCSVFLQYFPLAYNNIVVINMCTSTWVECCTSGWTEWASVNKSVSWEINLTQSKQF